MRCSLALVIASVLVAGVVAVPGRAAAQIVNVQPLVAEEAKPGLSGTAEGSVDWRTGATELLLVSGKLLARWRCDPNLVLLLGSLDLGVSKDARIIDRSLVHLRYRRSALAGIERLAGEAFVQHDRDAFRRLALRALVGAGPRVALVDRARVDLAVAAAYMLELERYSDGDFGDAGDQQLTQRLSTYAVAAWNAADRVKLGETVYVQPALTDPADVKILSESELLVTITIHVAFKTSFRLAYDTRPPETVPDLDTALKSSIQVNF